MDRSHIRSRFLAALALSGLTLGALATGSAEAAAPNAGMVWVAQQGTHRVYIAGSIHLLKPGTALPSSLDHAYRDTKKIVMEIDIDDMDANATASYVMAHGMYSGGDTLDQHLSATQRLRVSQAAASSGLPLPMLQMMEPWLAAITLTDMQMAQLGLDPHSGVEEQIKTRAVTDHKEISGFETVEEQLHIFDDLPMAEQIQFLDMTLDDAADAKNELDELTNAWLRGDDDKIARLSLRDYARFPKLMEPLLAARNARWLPKIRALLAGDEDVMILVGAAHLVGDRGVIALLAQSGVRLERVVN